MCEYIDKPYRRETVDLLAERDRQVERWGEQNHEDGTGCRIFQFRAEKQKSFNDRMVRAGRSISWMNILLEEVWEALAESDPEKLRTELIQVAAVAQTWAAAIDRRTE